jgi:hypothetical protein
MIKVPYDLFIRGPDNRLFLSFLWNEMVRIDIQGLQTGLLVSWLSGVRFYRIPYLCSASALIFVSGLCGLSCKSKFRTLAGLLGIAGVISYFVLIFPQAMCEIGPAIRSESLPERIYSFPYFGSAQHEWSKGFYRTYSMWFLSVGFYLALAGSLMLLLPLIKTLIERLRKRL